MSAQRADQQADDVGYQDLATFSSRAQAGCLDHGRSEAIPFFDRHVAGREPDADLKAGRVRRGSMLPVDSPLDRHSGRNRFGRPCEYRHDTVAKPFDHSTVVGIYRSGHQAVMEAAHLFGGILTEPHTELGRTDNVSEEDDGGRRTRTAHVGNGTWGRPRADMGSRHPVQGS